MVNRSKGQKVNPQAGHIGVRRAATACPFSSMLKDNRAGLPPQLSVLSWPLSKSPKELLVFL